MIRDSSAACARCDAKGREGLQTLQRREPSHVHGRVVLSANFRMQPTSTPSAHTAKQVAVLRKQALSYPEAHEDFPWGHSAFKVKGKAFAFLHADREGFSISVKLPDSNALALHLPFAEPTGYGLGKSGWVTARFANGQLAPLPVLSAWLEESFMAIAPKRLVAAFLGSHAGPGTLAPARAAATRAAHHAKSPKQKPALKAGAKRAPPPKGPTSKTAATKARKKSATKKTAGSRNR
jgi:predicted DNA-binding protein (MmcQ/YjbR family)